MTATGRRSADERVEEQSRGRFDRTSIGGGVVMVSCCAVGPAVIGGVARRMLDIACEAWPFVVVAVLASLALALAGWTRPTAGPGPSS